MAMNNTGMSAEDAANKLRQDEQDMEGYMQRYYQLAANMERAVRKRETDRIKARLALERQQQIFRRILWIVCLALAGLVAFIFYSTQLAMLG